jgi:lysophospholipase L1-like esterase
MRRRRIVAIALTAAVALATAACTGPAPDTTAPPGDGPLVAFYGDSYTIGTALADPDDRWATLLSEERGWREFNPSVNGLGFVNNRSAVGAGTGDLPDLIIAENPDIVIVTLGLNDAFSFPTAGDRIRDTLRDDLRRLADELPDARLVVAEPFWYTDERPDAVGIISGWLEEAAAEVGADWIAGSGAWLDGHYAGAEDSWIGPDGLHPDERGHREIAERMSEALAALDPPL